LLGSKESNYVKKQKYSCSYSPQHNGVVERKNMHIAKITRAMLNEKNLPDYFWVEAVAIVVYIMKQTPTTIVHGMTLEKKFIGKKLDVSHLRVFSSITYLHVPNEKKSKLDAKVEKCIFIGYSLEQKGYRCFNPSLLEILSFATNHYATSMQLIVVCNYLGHICNYKFGIV